MMDQMHLVISPTKIAELDSVMIERIHSEDFTKGLWLSVPEIIDWSQVDSFKYRDANSARTYTDVHIREFLNDVGSAKNVSVEMLKKRRHVFAVSQQTGDVYDAWPVYRCLYCEIDQATRHSCSTTGNGIGSELSSESESTSNLPRYLVWSLGSPTLQTSQKENSTPG